MSKHLLQKSDLPPFTEWLDKMRIEHRDPRGDYQVMQIKRGSSPEWFVIYRRDSDPDFLTVDHRLDGLVRLYFKNKERDNASKNTGAATPNDNGESRNGMLDL